ncbi:YfhO family protein [Patescibacteria group bacterium]|nr:YfhO family protein [Patescibacteria group bacterium]
MDKKTIIKLRFAIGLVYHNILLLLIPALLISFFFFRLFFPNPSLFMIPDFGESDVLHLNLPLKFILSQSLRSKNWPLWTPYLGGGFPILAEGQIGTFYLPNLISFRFLPFITAYNLNLLFAYVLIFAGSFLFFRILNLSKTASIAAATVFTFSGYLSVHLNHFDLIQAASLLPLIYWSVVRLWKKKHNLQSIILTSFLLSQQIFTGHFYIVFITLIGAAMIFLMLYIFDRKNTSISHFLYKSGLFLSALLLTFLLSAIQLFPTIELWKQSTRKAGLDYNTVTAYPFSFKEFVTFLKPYFFGSPANGTYPQFSNDWGVFWENTGYIGIIPLTMALACLLFFRDKRVRIAAVMLFFSLLLVLGKNSPLYFVFSFPPFSFFRVPSKFLLLTDFSLAFLVAILLHKTLESIRGVYKKSALYKTKLITVLFLLCLLAGGIVGDEYHFSYSYPPTTPANWWTTPPETAKLLQAQPKGGVTDIGSRIAWNEIFLTHGWDDIKLFSYLRNYIYPNYNSLFSLKGFDVNTGGLVPIRQKLFISAGQQWDTKNNIATVSAVAKNILSLAGIRYVLSPYRLDGIKTEIVDTVRFPAKKIRPISIYKNISALPNAYMSYKTKFISTLDEFFNALENHKILTDRTVLIENKHLAVNNNPETLNNVKLIKSHDNQNIWKVYTENKGIFVISDTYYPGWSANVDGKSVQIAPVNLTQRGIPLEMGEHTVILRYEPLSFALGKYTTYATMVIIVSVLLVSLSISHHKVYGKTQPYPYPGNKRHNLST